MVNRFVIHVTQQDIDSGRQCDGNACPVALAIKRTIGPLFVGALVIKTSECGQDVVRTPMKVRQFISEFDSGLVRPEPFDFELNIPIHLEP